MDLREGIIEAVQHEQGRIKQKGASRKRVSSPGSQNMI